MKTSFVLLTILACFFFSCGSGNSGQATNAASAPAESPPPSYDTALPKGKVTDSVICRIQNSQSYALYLPSYYSPAKKFPCIYFFDSHGRGAMPVSKYKGLAEKYGFVLAGSNVSKNGTPWPVTNELVKTLMDDTHARINIDAQRIYTGGFSGGSRVASSVAIMIGGVAGVIGCGAGFPNVEEAPRNKFDYFGMVGDDDFNLTEMEQLDNALQQNGFAHQLLTFSGKHGWPSSSDFETALLWIQANAMKENLQPKNDTLIASLRNDYDKRIKEVTASGEIIREHELLDGMIRTLDGLSDVSGLKSQLAALVAGAEFQKAVAIQSKWQEVELKQQQELVHQFTMMDDKWWAKKIAEINGSIRNAKTKEESQMNQRLLNYLGLVGYMNTSHALNADDLTNAATYLKVFKMADPQNPDCSYLAAVYYMKTGDEQKAIAYLEEAAALGYSELATVAANPVFSKLMNNDTFKKVVDKMRANNKSD